MIESRPRLSTWERIGTLMIGGAIFMYLPSALMWGFVSFWAGLKTLVIGLVVIWIYISNKERRERDQDKSTIEALVAAAGSASLRGLASRTPKETMHGVKEGPAGFAVDDERGWLYVLSDGQVRRFGRDQVRDFQVPEWNPPARVHTRTYGAGFRRAGQIAMDDHTDNMQAQAAHHERHCMRIQLRDVDLPEFVIWIPPKMGRRYGEMLNQFIEGE